MWLAILYIGFCLIRAAASWWVLVLAFLGEAAGIYVGHAFGIRWACLPVIGAVLGLAIGTGIRLTRIDTSLDWR